MVTQVIYLSKMPRLSIVHMKGLTITSQRVLSLLVTRNNNEITVTGTQLY